MGGGERKMLTMVGGWVEEEGVKMEIQEGKAQEKQGVEEKET